jgi:hypothetical protein
VLALAPDTRMVCLVQAADARTDVRNVIDLASHDVTVVPLARQPDAFTLNTRARAFQLVAESPDDRDDWVLAIRYGRARANGAASAR